LATLDRQLWEAAPDTGIQVKSEVPFWDYVPLLGDVPSPAERPMTVLTPILPGSEGGRSHAGERK